MVDTGVGSIPKRNRQTNAQIALSHIEAAIFQADHFYIEGHIALGVEGTLYAKIVTPDTDEWTHFTWIISSNGILETTFHEIPTGGMENGNRATIHANNRAKDCWSGRQTGGNNQALLTDSSQAWTTNELIGKQVFNQTDGSSAIITANTANTVTATLSGSTSGNNDWDTGDLYEINNSNVVITSGVTVATSLGLEISHKDVGGTGFKADVGGTTTLSDELVLRPNTTYLRKFLSGTDAQIISFRASWRKHEDLV